MESEEHYVVSLACWKIQVKEERSWQRHSILTFLAWKRAILGFHDERDSKVLLSIVL